MRYTVDHIEFQFKIAVRAFYRDGIGVSVCEHSKSYAKKGNKEFLHISSFYDESYRCFSGRFYLTTSPYLDSVSILTFVVISVPIFAFIMFRIEEKSAVPVLELVHSL